MMQLSIFAQEQEQASGAISDEALPRGWVWTTVGEITEPIAKVNPSARPQEEIIYLDISSIDNAAHTLVDHKIYRGKDAPSRARQQVRAGDVLFSTVRTYLENIAVVPPAFDGQVASTGFSILRGQSGVSSRYLFYYSLTKPFLSGLEALQRGTSYPAVRDEDVRAQPIPLAPSAEQERIVAEIEQQFTRLDAAVAALKRAQANLKRYKAAVLKAACEGALVPQDPSDEPAAALLARILAARRAQWEADLRAKGKNPATARYDEPAAPNTNDLPALPAGWRWSTIGSLFKVRIGATPSRQKPEYWEGDIPWVSSGEVAFRRITETRECITDAGLNNSSTKLCPPGTVLLAMIGEGKTRGQAAILDIEAATNQNMAAILCSQTPIQPAWLYYWFMHQYDDTRRVGSGGMQPALNSERVRQIPIVLPPLAEQERIIDEIERLLSVVQEQETVIAHSLTRAERLRKAILAHAFAGRLVPQDPADEPASALLDRIQTVSVSRGVQRNSHSPRFRSRMNAQGNSQRRGNG